MFEATLRALCFPEAFLGRSRGHLRGASEKVAWDCGWDIHRREDSNGSLRDTAARQFLECRQCKQCKDFLHRRAPDGDVPLVTRCAAGLVMSVESGSATAGKFRSLGGA